MKAFCDMYKEKLTGGVIRDKQPKCRQHVEWWNTHTYRGGWGGWCGGDWRMAGWCGSTQSDSLGQLHLDLLADLLPLLVAADGEDVAVLQLLLAGPVPKLHGQQLLPHPAREGPCCCRAQIKVSNSAALLELPNTVHRLNSLNWC